MAPGDPQSPSTNEEQKFNMLEQILEQFQVVVLRGAFNLYYF